MEGDSSPPLGARRRFSALMDTHRFASPLEADSEIPARQPPIKARGMSLEGATVPPPGQVEPKHSLKEGAEPAAGGEGSWECGEGEGGRKGRAGRQE